MESITNDTMKKSIRVAIQKIDLRLMPFIFLLHFIAYTNLVTISYARSHGLKEDLHLTPTEDKLAASLLYAAYLIFAVPSHLILLRMDKTIYLSILLAGWGLLSIGCAFVTNGTQLIIVQFLLGMLIAGFFPGIIYHLAVWYHRDERTLRIVIFYLGALLANAIGGTIGYGIIKMDGLGGHNGWQWIYILLGPPVILLGLVVFLFLSNGPGDSGLLNVAEKEALINYLRDATDIDPDERIEKRQIQWKQVSDVFRDPFVWSFTVIIVANLVGVKYWALSFSHLMQTIGYEQNEEPWMTVPPFILAGVCAIVGAIVVTKRKEHGYCVLFFLCMSSIGFILMVALDYNGQAAMYVSICVACAGTYSAFTLLVAWLVSTVRGHKKKALAVSLVTGLGQIFGIVFPFMNYAHQIEDYRRSHIICAIAMGVAAILTFFLRFFLEKRKQNAATSAEVLTNASPQQVALIWWIH